MFIGILVTAIQAAPTRYAQPCDAGFYHVDLIFTNVACFPCPSGTFADANSTECKPKRGCPKDTVYVDSPLTELSCQVS